MKKKLIAGIIGLTAMSTVLTGCNQTDAQKVMAQQNANKQVQAASMMEKTPTPNFNRSLERENIINRLKNTNDPNQLTWIYPMSAGRVIGRFPVRGKITSGGKRLTSTQQWIPSQVGEGYTLGEAPDEMGAYGSSGDYVFWFDPAGRGPFQHRGDYFVTPVPYKIDLGYGTITYEVDANEESKRTNYETQIKNNQINGGK